MRLSQRPLAVLAKMRLSQRALVVLAVIIVTATYVYRWDDSPPAPTPQGGGASDPTTSGSSSRRPYFHEVPSTFESFLTLHPAPDAARHMTKSLLARTHSGDTFEDMHLKTGEVLHIPTLQTIFNNLYDHVFVAPPTAFDQDFYVPFLEISTTDWDFGFVLQQLSRIDAHVGRVIIAANSNDTKMTNILLAFRDAFPGRFLVKVLSTNTGISGGWNVGLRVTFRLPWHEYPLVGAPVIDPFCIIANADTYIMPGYMGLWAQHIQSRMHDKATFHILWWSCFAVTVYGFEELGYFDENFFPAYGEDNEYSDRRNSRFGVEETLGNVHYVSDDSFSFNSLVHHYGSPTAKRSSTVNTMVQRFSHGREYIMRKWNVSLGPGPGKHWRHMFKYPFNNPNIWHNESWMIDPQLRECISTGKGEIAANFYNERTNAFDPRSYVDAPCRFDVSSTKTLEHTSGPLPLPVPRIPYDTHLLRTLKRRGTWDLVRNTFRLEHFSAARCMMNTTAVIRWLRPGAHTCDSRSFMLVPKPTEQQTCSECHVWSLQSM